MANVSYLRTPAQGSTTTYSTNRFGTARKRRRAPWIVGGLLLVAACVLAAGALVVSSSKASLGPQSGALAKVNLPLGGGTIQDVTVTSGVQNAEKFVKFHLTGDPIIVPAQKIASGRKLTVSLVVHRPSWISWLSGKSERLTRTVVTPDSHLRDRYVTLSRSGALQVHFSKAVRSVAYGPSVSRLTRHPLGAPTRTVTIPHDGPAGTLYLSATVQKWETASTSSVSWFPAGTKATAIARPGVGKTITSDTPITLTFSKPLGTVLGHHMPTVSPAGTGSWHRISSHELRYVPTGYGYGLDQSVKVALPAGVRLTGGTHDGSSTSGVWHVPGGSTARLNQVLAQLGYLPMTVHYADGPPANTLAAQLTAAERTPQAKLQWAYGNVPSGLSSQWGGQNSAGELTKGAVMAFESSQGMDPDGIAGPTVWKALIKAVATGQHNSFGYTFVSVSEGSPENLFVWHNGKTVLSGIPVNTGVPGATTQTGTFAVDEHIPETRMIGTDVDGTHYNVEVKWVSYFNGGDALHYYYRASYGFPQSNGCVEMDLSNAENVYQYTPVGTIVQVNG